MYLLSQVLVFVSDILFIISTLSKRKKNIIFYLLLSTILFSIHYACLGGWTGAVVGIVELLFLIPMLILESKKITKYNLLITSITIVITVILTSITWQGFISLLPMFAMIIYYLSMMFSNIIIIKCGTFLRVALNAIYMFLIESYL